MHKTVRLLFATLAGLTCLAAERDPQPPQWLEAYANNIRQHQDVFAAHEKDDVAAVLRFLKAIKPSSNAGDHFVAGDLFFQLGELDAAYREHAAVTGALAKAAQYEAVADLVALRRFDEACGAFRRLHPDVAVMQHDAFRAYMQVRCGAVDEGRKLLVKTLPDQHSSAEESLARLFAEQRRFVYYKHILEGRLESEPGDAVAARALGELLVCGDFSNPWHPRHHHREAAERFEKLLAATPGNCVFASRQAVTEILEVEGTLREKARPKDFAKPATLLRPFLGEGLACEEAAIAQYLYLDVTARNDGAKRTALLEQAVAQFPESGRVRMLLLDRYREEGKFDAIGLREALRKFPDQWMTYTRLAFAGAVRDGTAGLEASWLEQGLAKLPDSLPLNYSAAIVRLKAGSFDAAISPSARTLCGLMETKIHVDAWKTGIGLLAAAMDKKSPWPQDPKESEASLKRFASGPAIDALEHRSDTGCFGSGGGSVATVPVWFEPAFVQSAVAKFGVNWSTVRTP